MPDTYIRLMLLSIIIIFRDTTCCDILDELISFDGLMFIMTENHKNRNKINTTLGNNGMDRSSKNGTKSVPFRKFTWTIRHYAGK